MIRWDCQAQSGGVHGSAGKSRPVQVFDRVAACQAKRIKYAERADVDAAFHVYTRYKMVVEEQGGKL